MVPFSSYLLVIIQVTKCDIMDNLESALIYVVKVKSQMNLVFLLLISNKLPSKSHSRVPNMLLIHSQYIFLTGTMLKKCTNK